MKKEIKGFVMGLACATLLTGGVAYAASNTVKLEVNYGIKLIQNGIDKTPTGSAKPFIANGNTYVPLSVVSDLVRVKTTWDSNNKRVIIGEKNEGKSLGTPDLLDHNLWNKPSLSSNKSMMINGKSYGSLGFKIDSAPISNTEYVNLNYILNNRYSELKLSLGIDDEDLSNYSFLRNISFENEDGDVLKQVSLGGGSVQENITVNLTGVQKLVIEITGDGYGVVDFINPTIK
ncbi:stalk domain-containing protein [Paenibacillus polymyxa]|uniref:stalk domain-containing protein n=1 Tax=Paenibacillus polymyxa TaxID=1406 RepID=UPI0004DF99FC|nr:stalk domain-containing protein [Paenibacillus polymyxa]